MTLFKNTPELNNSLNWCYFDTFFNNHNFSALDYILMVDITKSAPAIAKMLLMRKFDNFETAK